MEKDNLSKSIRNDLAFFTWGAAFGSFLTSAMYLWLRWRDKKEREEN